MLSVSTYVLPQYWRDLATGGWGRERQRQTETDREGDRETERDKRETDVEGERFRG